MASRVRNCILISQLLVVSILFFSPIDRVSQSKTTAITLGGIELSEDLSKSKLLELKPKILTTPNDPKRFFLVEADYHLEFLTNGNKIFQATLFFFSPEKLELYSNIELGKATNHNSKGIEWVPRSLVLRSITHQYGELTLVYHFK